MNSVLPLKSDWIAEETDFSGASSVSRNLTLEEPCYLYSADQLQRQAARFLTGFPGVVSYAVKANPEPRVIRTLAQSGVQHFDVASPQEAKLIAGLAPQATLHYNNPIKAERAIELAYRECGVRSFAVDGTEELLKIRRVTGGDPNVMYSVRFCLSHASASYDFGSKFGATPEETVELLQLAASGGARLALTFHPGSQCTDPQAYARYIQVAAKIVERSGEKIEFLNVGGGFPEHYDRLDLSTLEDYFAVIEKAVATSFDSPPRLMCEPGRAMVASCISLMTSIIHVRPQEGSVFLNDGVYGSFQEQVLINLHLPLRVWRNGVELGGDCVPYTVFGPTCDPVDRLPYKIELPRDIKEGDHVEFGLLGAYGSATSTTFNGFPLAQYVSVEEGFPLKA
jgi:ornithine decarboxylase